jgi:tripartite-type tricarboxylate transporter receptor subunit TctC
MNRLIAALLIAGAKASQRKLSYSSPYIGSPPHLGAALFAHLTGTQMVHIPYKEAAQVYVSVANGDVRDRETHRRDRRLS